jgi:hypothetical protein
MRVLNLSARCAVRVRKPPAAAQRGDGAAVPRFTWHSAGGDGHGRERNVLGVHWAGCHGTRHSVYSSNVLVGVSPTPTDTH